MRKHRAIRYEIHVDGEVVESHSKHVAALNRAKVIRQTWTRAERIEVIDTWGRLAREAA